MAAPTVIAVASLGIVVNGLSAWLVGRGRRDDLNVRAAASHLAADAAVSLGVVLTGVVLVFTHWPWLDPVVSLAVSALIVVGTWGILRESLDLAMDAVPGRIDPVAVRGYLETVPGVVEVHDFHVWAMSTTEIALTAHLVTDRATLDDELTAQSDRTCRGASASRIPPSSGRARAARSRVVRDGPTGRRGAAVALPQTARLEERRAQQRQQRHPAEDRGQSHPRLTHGAARGEQSRQRAQPLEGAREQRQLHQPSGPQPAHEEQPEERQAAHHQAEFAPAQVVRAQPSALRPAGRSSRNGRTPADLSASFPPAASAPGPRRRSAGTCRAS